MLQRFKDIGTRPARALQVYLILLGAAQNRQTLTYGALANVLGYEGAGVLSDTLGHIMYWCQEQNLPSLTSLVVNQDSGLPGGGLNVPADTNKERERIYEYDWYGIVPPTTEQLGAAYAGRKSRKLGATK